MNKLKEQLRLKMLGQLSDEKINIDINNAYDFAVSFCLFCAENYYYQGNDWWNKHYIDEALSTEELLYKFLEDYDKK